MKYYFRILFVFSVILISMTAFSQMTLVKNSKVTATQNRPLCPDSNHPHAIDMGAAGVWACCNVGANKPEDYGNYYAWGETETKSDYSRDTYKHKKGNNYENIGSDISGKITYDAATKNWGGFWCMPSVSQMKKLRNNCKSEWIQINGVNGMLFTASNGNRIFLPAAGHGFGSSSSSVGLYGFYWSSSLGASLFQTDANYLSFDSRCVYMNSCGYRYYGNAVRPVRR